MCRSCRLLVSRQVRVRRPPPGQRISPALSTTPDTLTQVRRGVGVVRSCTSRMPKTSVIAPFTTLTPRVGFASHRHRMGRFSLLKMPPYHGSRGCVVWTKWLVVDVSGNPGVFSGNLNDVPFPPGAPDSTHTGTKSQNTSLS